MLLPFGNDPVNLAKLLDLLPDQTLLLCEQGLGVADVQIVQIGADPIGGKTKLPQVPDDGQPVNVPQAVKAVSIFAAARPDQAKALIIAKGIGADAVQSGQLLDHIFVFHRILHLVTGIQPGNPPKMFGGNGGLKECLTLVLYQPLY